MSKAARVWRGFTLPLPAGMIRGTSNGISLGPHPAANVKVMPIRVKAVPLALFLPDRELIVIWKPLSPGIVRPLFTLRGQHRRHNNAPVQVA